MPKSKEDASKTQDGKGPPGLKGHGESREQRLIEKEVAKVGTVSKLGHLYVYNIVFCQ